MHNQITPRNSRADSSDFAISQSMTRQLMSSREIAKLTGKTHDNVLRDARLLVAGGVLKTEETLYRHAQNGQVYPEFLLTQRDALVVVSGYNAALRAKIIDRWQELESRAVAIPTSLPEALRLAADKAEENERLIGIIQHQAPKVAAIQRLAAAQGAVCLNEAAKLLQVTPRNFVEWLVNRDWLYRSGKRKRLAAKQVRIDQGYMAHKITELAPNDVTGQARAVPQPLVTPKGLTRLAVMLQEAQ